MNQTQQKLKPPTLKEVGEALDRVQKATEAVAKASKTAAAAHQRHMRAIETRDKMIEAMHDTSGRYAERNK